MNKFIVNDIYMLFFFLNYSWFFYIVFIYIIVNGVFDKLNKIEGFYICKLWYDLVRFESYNKKYICYM